jgi:hypothetical protein
MTETITAAFASETGYNMVLDEIFDNAFQVFFRNILPVCNFFERNIAIRLVFSHVDKDAQGIAPSGRD